MTGRGIIRTMAAGSSRCRRQRQTSLSSVDVVIVAGRSFGVFRSTFTTAVVLPNTQGANTLRTTDAPVSGRRSDIRPPTTAVDVIGSIQQVLYMYAIAIAVGTFTTFVYRHFD